jgi:hypothetical protein
MVAIGQVVILRHVKIHTQNAYLFCLKTIKVSAKIFLEGVKYVFTTD